MRFYTPTIVILRHVGKRLERNISIFKLKGLLGNFVKKKIKKILKKILSTLAP